jgi:hypothetical protein
VTSLQLARELVSQPLAWPGLYPRYAVTSDAAPLCHACCRSEQAQIATSTGSDGWQVIALAVNWEDTSLRCSHCDTTIPSAYGSP